MVCIKVTADKFTFDGWSFESSAFDAVHPAFNDAWNKVEAAILRTITSTLQMQFEEDGIDVYLVEAPEDVEGVPAINVALCFLTIADGQSSPFSIDVRFSDLVDEMIRTDPNGARILLPAMREIIAKLEAIPAPQMRGQP
jgi:ribosomal protein S12 methylthiotransferase accessory factor YcaO